MWLTLFWAFVAFIPFSFALNPTPTADLQASRVFVLILFGFWLIYGLAQKKIIIDRRFRTFLFSIFLFLCCLSFFWSIDQGRATRKIIFILNFVPLYLISFGATSQEKYRLFLLKILAWSGSLLGLFGLILFFSQFVFGIDPMLNFTSEFISPFFLGTTFSNVVLSYPSWLVNIGGKNFIRAFGTFPDPHLFSLYLNMLLPLVFLLCAKTKEKKYYFMLSIIFFASLFAFSRAAYISLIGLLIFLLSTSNLKGFFQKKPLLIFLFIFLFCTLSIVPNPLSERLSSSFNPTEGSNSGRIEMWQKAIAITKKFPWQGVGIGNFSRFTLPSAGYRDPIYAHNLFLDFSSETGIPSALFLIAFLLSPIFIFFKEPTPLKKAIAASIIILIGHSLFETPFFSVHILPLSLIILGFNTNE